MGSTNSILNLNIREYHQDDAAAVGSLIKVTYSKYNLDFLSREEMTPFLGPFAYADVNDPDRQAALHEVIQSQMVYVADVNGSIAGVLRGRMDRLASLFVSDLYHRQGIGSSLVARFEEELRSRGGSVVRVASSIYAVPFYLKIGYKKSTGQRQGWSFNGWGLPYQPMKKVL